MRFGAAGGPGLRDHDGRFDQRRGRAAPRATRARLRASAAAPSIEPRISGRASRPLTPRFAAQLEEDAGRRGARRRAGARAESRPATTTIALSDVPGRVSRTFRSSTSSPSKRRLEALLGDRAGGDLARSGPDQVGGRRVALRARARARAPPGRSAAASSAPRVGVELDRRRPAGSSGSGHALEREQPAHDQRCEDRCEAESVGAEVEHGARYPYSYDRRGLARGSCSWTTSPPFRPCSAYPLRKDGYEVVSAVDGREALDRFAEQRFDLVVLDIMLPKLDGIEVCRRLRSRSQVPIIMLTAKDDEIDKVLGLEMGADDYITKPFSVREFRSRVRAALRRAEMAGGGQAATSRSSPASCGSTSSAARSQMRGGAVQLTYVEFEMLAALAARPGRVFTRETLLERVWGDSAYRDPRTIDVHIRHLREKLERDPSEPEYLFTVRGVGYRFRDGDGAEAACSAQRSQPAGPAVLRDHRRGDRLRLPLRRPAALVEPHRGEAPPAAAGGRREPGAAARRGDRRGRSQAELRRLVLAPRAARPAPGSRCSASREEPPGRGRTFVVADSEVERTALAPELSGGDGGAATGGGRERGRADRRQPRRARRRCALSAGGRAPLGGRPLDAARRRRRQRRPDQAPDPDRGRDRAGRGAGRRLLRRPGALAAAAPPGGGRRAGRRGRLLDADPGRLATTRSASWRRRSNEMRMRLERLDTRPQGVHRQRLARAAHADLLAGRLRRAARRGGPGPGVQGGVRAPRCANRSIG